MIVRYAASFKKQYKKLPVKIQQQFDQRLRLFLIDPASPQLRVHPLQGKFAGYWSLNVTGDIRAIYQQHGQKLIIFFLIGSHSQLYGK